MLAIVISFIITAAITLGLGLAYNPVNAFAMIGTGIVIVLVAIYILMYAACIGYFAASRNRKGEAGIRSCTWSSLCWASPRSCPPG